MIPIFGFLADITKTIVKSQFPDKAEIARSIAQSDSKTSAAEIQDLMSGSSRWRKKIAYVMSSYFIMYGLLYYLIPQYLHLTKQDDFYMVMETDGHLHSMYISGGIVVISIIGREIVKLVRAFKA